jgi:superfamily II DNA or RNA helicase
MSSPGVLAGTDSPGEVDPETPLSLRSGIALRKWQQLALADWAQAGNRGILEVVTGAGKTLVAEKALVDTINSRTARKAIIVVPTVALQDQWIVSLQEDLGLSRKEVAAFGGGKRLPATSLVNVLVLNTARTEAPRIAASVRSVLIVDECHRAGSKENAKALEGSYAATLGLSATPEREYDDALTTVLIPRLGPVVYRYTLEQALKDRVIVPFDVVNVHVDLLPDEDAKYSQLSRRIARAMNREDPEILRSLLLRRARISARASMRLPVAARLVDEHRGQRLLIFHEDIGQANALWQTLVQRGHSATIYHSRISPEVRRDNLRLYRQGAFDVLVTCRALDEGANVPETIVAVIASSTASARQRVQRLGRVLRPAKDKAKAIVYTLYATEVEEQRLQAELARSSVFGAVRWTRAVARRG